MSRALPWARCSGPQGPPGTRGRATIADGVVEKVARIAARKVPGIHALGGGFTRTMGAVRDRVPGEASAGCGVKAKAGEKQIAIGLQVVVEYGVSIAGHRHRRRPARIACFVARRAGARAPPHRSFAVSGQSLTEAAIALIRAQLGSADGQSGSLPVRIAGTDGAHHVLSADARFFGWTSRTPRRPSAQRGKQAR
ncbi:Asp23/Gls24 family envelope stress response protein [Streptomyces canus]|uniref:Asp23/Gls24 family envelope stress response protein n=1 Tax=Streptomyces canus TaxID=58343 RepID=UPI0035937229